MKKVLLIAVCILLNSCVGGKDLYYTAVKGGDVLKDAKENVLDHGAFDKQLKDFVDEKGFVDYAGWKKQHSKLKEYLSYLNDNAPKDGWSQAEQFAYYINLYNAATVNLVLENNMPASIKDIDGPLGQVWLKDAANVNGKMYSLAAIEKNVLQKMGDPRIHFAINCASFSCPKLQNKAFTATNVNTLMEKGAQEFFNSNKNDLSDANNPNLSEIMNWYKSDFTDTGLSVIGYVNKYATNKVAENATIGYISYDWSLNKQ